MQKIPCMYPLEHGVQHHIAGTAAARRCQNQASYRQARDTLLPPPAQQGTGPRFFRDRFTGEAQYTERPQDAITHQSIVGFISSLDNDYGEGKYAYSFSGRPGHETIVLCDMEDEGIALALVQHGYVESADWFAPLNGFPAGTTVEASTDIEIRNIYDFDDWDEVTQSVNEELGRQGCVGEATQTEDGLRIQRGAASEQEFQRTLAVALNEFGRQAAQREWEAEE